jgi:Major Facilitator Superfamily
LGAALGLLTAVPVGALADRYGPRRVLVVVSLWRSRLCGFPLVHDLAGFLLVVCLLGVVQNTAAPLEQALVGRVVARDDRVRTMAIMRAVRNVGFTVGALMGTLALGLDTRPAYVAIVVVNALSFVALAAMAATLREPTSAGAALRRPSPFRVLRDPAVSAARSAQRDADDPLDIAERGRAGLDRRALKRAASRHRAAVDRQHGARGALSGPGQSRSRHDCGRCGTHALWWPRSRRLLRDPRRRAVPAGRGRGRDADGGNDRAHTGELFQSAGGWGLSYELAREGDEAAYLSVFWLGYGIQQVIAPVLVAAVVVAGASGWLALGAFLALIGLAVPRSAQHAAATRPALQPVIAAGGSALQRI